MSDPNNILQISCPTCGRNLKTKREHVGRRLKCPSCSAIFTVEAPPTFSPPSVTPMAPQPMTSVNPYQAPAMMDNVASPAAPGHVAYPYESGNVRAKMAMLLVGCCMLVYGVMIFARYNRLEALERENISMINDADQLVNMITLALMAVGIASAVTYLMWMHRAYRNLPSLGQHKLKMTPGWAVGYWFIPIINLFRPYQAMADIWKGSCPEGIIPGSKSSPPSTVNIWWMGYIILGVVNIFGNIIFQGGIMGRRISEVIRGETILIWALFGGIILGGITIMMIFQIDKNQTKRCKILSEDQPV